ncbi:PREDICTED: histone-lysine N-methyltransferase SETMAR-like [Dinoponera quadriceps]|uniref:Histone-lysine N-methyltransferase SETMAR-like n=1 Tax=Dinoponera quadriceps TaxID=609295 RepID=A0A6P3WYY4_DINQU|nr:PREDICTED: histone-lysine N-methyltransferase SETMAR-like [Dinoponera quadriceps]
MIHYDFMKPGSSITAEIYCNQLDEMMQKLKEKQPRLVNRSTPILLHNNARPHNAQMTGKTTGIGVGTSSSSSILTRLSPH